MSDICFILTCIQTLKICVGDDVISHGDQQTSWQAFAQNLEIDLLDFSPELEICKIIHTLTGSCAGSTSLK